MKRLRLIGLTAMVAMAFTALGAGSASADLYTDAAKTVKYKTGTTVFWSLNTGWTSAWKSGPTTVATCTGGAIHEVTENETGTVSGSVSETTWSGCSQTTHTVANGKISIDTSGNVTGSGSQVTFGIFGVTCTYGLGEGTKLGTLTSGETPVLNVATNLPKTAGGFLCPSTLAWEAKYTITTPHSLYVG